MFNVTLERMRAFLLKWTGNVVVLRSERWSVTRTVEGRTDESTLSGFNDSAMDENLFERQKNFGDG
jgi:hypothetical protein